MRLRPTHASETSGHAVRRGRPVLAMSLFGGLLLGTSALVAVSHMAQAQEAQEGLVEFQDFGLADQNEQMLVEADQLIYDQEADEVSAVGNVQIYYGDTTLQADRVVYKQSSQRVRAEGNVRITEPDGNVIFADEIDLSDDFRDGFVRSLTVETPDQTTITAANAERTGDNVTVFNRGLYTACPRCEDNPQKPPFWQVKAVRIVHDQEKKTITYENASLEFFGVPVAYVPFFTSPDPTVKRKSGFLSPSIRTSDMIGVGVVTPYFWNIAPHRDVTISPIWSPRQGVIPQIEYRQRTQSGTFSVTGAGVYQLDPADEPDNPGDDLDTRGYINTRGLFRINDMWEWGWDVTDVSDRGFLDSYGISSSNDLASSVFLTGLSERNYFDVRVNRFEQLNSFSFDQNRLPLVHPSVDYNYIVDRPVLQGQLAFDVNIYSLTRDDIDDSAAFSDLAANGLTASDYADGSRFTAEASWETSLVDGIGQVYTPFVSLRGDAFSVADGYNAARLPGATIGTEPQDTWLPVTYSESNEARVIPTVGLEYRFPFSGSFFGGSHVIEPVAQIYYRPDLDDDQVLLNNEDALSLVFDTTNLFERDKFSGFDRVETGTRANVGVRYTANLTNFGLVNIVFGQSYQIAGENPFPNDSGLEEDTSDYVASGNLRLRPNIDLGVSARFDEEDLSVERTDAYLAGRVGRISAALRYSLADSQPTLGSLEDEEQALLSGGLELTDEWRLTGTTRYDLERDRIDSNSVEVHFHNECFALSFGVAQDFDANGEESYSARLNVNLRTLGGFGTSTQQVGAQLGAEE